MSNRRAASLLAQWPARQVRSGLFVGYKPSAPPLFPHPLTPRKGKEAGSGPCAGVLTASEGGLRRRRQVWAPNEIVSPAAPASCPPHSNPPLGGQRHFLDTCSFFLKGHVWSRPSGLRSPGQTMLHLRAQEEAEMRRGRQCQDPFSLARCPGPLGERAPPAQSLWESGGSARRWPQEGAQPGLCWALSQLILPLCSLQTGLSLWLPARCHPETAGQVQLTGAL